MRSDIVPGGHPSILGLEDGIDHVRGPDSAPVVLEYGDYECPYSRQAFRAIEQVERRHPGGIRFAFRHFPLTEIHPHALAAASCGRGRGVAGPLLGDARAPLPPPARPRGRRPSRVRRRTRPRRGEVRARPLRRRDARAVSSATSKAARRPARSPERRRSSSTASSIAAPTTPRRCWRHWPDDRDNPEPSSPSPSASTRSAT